MKKIIKEIEKSFNKRPFWTAYSLLLCPLYYFLVAVTALVIGLIMLDIDSSIEYWDENT